MNIYLCIKIGRPYTENSVLWKVFISIYLLILVISTFLRWLLHRFLISLSTWNASSFTDLFSWAEIAANQQSCETCWFLQYSRISLKCTSLFFPNSFFFSFLALSLPNRWPCMILCFLCLWIFSFWKHQSKLKVGRIWQDLYLKCRFCTLHS